jgi:hypothetical protein
MPNGSTSEQVVSGFVDARGAGGAKSSGKGEWTLRFAFEVWRDAAGVTRHEELTVSREVDTTELRDFLKCIRAGQLLSARVRITSPGRAELIVLEDGHLDPTDPFVLRANERAKPKMREHSRFGTLVFDPRVDWYSGRARWGAVEVDINVSATEDAEIDRALEVAEQLWRDQASWDRRIREFAVRKLLPMKNKTWLDEDERELTQDQFEARMTLESITVDPDGGFDFMHADGDLFWGHAIEVTGNLKDGPTGAHTPG